MSEISDTKINFGVLPHGWKLVTLTEVVEFTKKPRSLSINPEDNLPFIPMEMIPENNDSIARWQEKKNSEISSGTFVFKGDLIVAKITPCFENGKQAILDNLPTDCAYTTTEVWPMHPKENQILLDFLSNYLRIPTIRKELTAKMEGSTNRQRLPREALQNLIIPLPPLPEQHAIATTLRTVQEAKENADAVIAATKALKAAMMKHLFTYGPVPPKDAERVALKETEIGLVPEGWKIKNFEDFCILQRGHDLRICDIQAGTVPVIGATTIIGYHNVANVKGPGVTVVRSGSSSGKTLYIETDFWAHNVVLYVKNFKGNNPKFVHYKLQQLDLTQYKSGVSVPTLNRNTFSMISVDVPPKKIQDKIVDTIIPIERKLAAEQSRKEALDTLFTSLLQDLMTAKIRVNQIAV
jgi:type I restriction enzyme, S subunit